MYSKTVQIGGIYFCKKNKDIGGSSGHHWLIVYADNEKILYIIFTSKKPKHHPACAVFLVENKIKDEQGKSVFSRETILNCFYHPEEITTTEFNEKIENEILEYRNANLQDNYLAQIIPCVASVNDVAPTGGGWSKNTIKEVLDNQYGIGSIVDGFFEQCRK